ncbi:thioesterase domain-containing protein [Streptomyces sp. NPDC026092]|uniref:thioesterase domain-containing protein n=1 Tax=Streptomyces sp. NPDC026092 TaxID=3154797 RepID=UPI0033CA1DEC
MFNSAPVPYASVGHRMGAVLAYETARRLTDIPGPAHLLLSGRAAPGPTSARRPVKATSRSSPSPSRRCARKSRRRNPRRPARRRCS